MIRILTIVACAAAAAPALAQEPAQPQAGQQAMAPASADPARLYGVRQSIEQIDISPDGNHIVYLLAGPGRTTSAYLADLNNPGAQPHLVVTSTGAPDRLRRCQFVTNDRLICRISAMMADGSQLLPFSRLASIDTDGRNVTALGQRRSSDDADIRQYDGAILDWLTAADGAVLMARNYVPEVGRSDTRLYRQQIGLGVDRIDVRTLHSTQVEAPNPRAGGYLSDGRGHVRIMAIPSERSDSGQLGTRTDYLYRTESSREWHPFGSYDAASGEGMVPIAVDPQLNAAYVLRKLNGRQALYRVKLDGSMATELVYANDHVDVDDVVWASRGSRVIGVTYAEEERHVVYFDPVYRDLARDLARAIPTLPQVGFGSASADGNRILVHAASESDAGRFYVYDRTRRSLNEILLARPQLEGVAPATVRAISYPAADGVAVPAYLTLPPNSRGRNLPAVILPHGGPASRDEWGFDWLAQFFAHLGYAVLQPQYRGSAGYGDQWLQQNGFRSWRTSIGDITAGARWLAAQGIADPNRTAIVGWSYGGYAALQAGAVDPGQFRAIVAIAPVTDLQQAKDDASGYSNARNVAEYIGSGPHVVEGSPLRRAAAITAPVLLFHGDRDLNVDVGHSRRMDAALRESGKRSELTIFPGLEHDLADSQVRIQMLSRIAAFLSAELAAH